HFVVAVDRLGLKGQLGAAVRDNGALHISQQDRGDVHLPVGDGQAQGAAVGLPFRRLGRQGVVEQQRPVGDGQGVALAGGQIAAQAQLPGLVQLRGGEGVVQGGDIVTQQVEDGRSEERRVGKESRSRWWGAQ